MKQLVLLLTIFIISCSARDKQRRLFEAFDNKVTAVIYLSKYKLDSIPKEIGELRSLKSLYIAKDCTSGWTVYPPLSALQKMAEIPPFRQLPNEITNLTKLQNLQLDGLDLQRLPDNFGNLYNLDTLSLMMNKLTISNEIEKLKKLKALKYLVVFGNKVDSTDIRQLRKANPNLVIESGLGRMKKYSW